MTRQRVAGTVILGLLLCCAATAVSAGERDLGRGADTTAVRATQVRIADAQIDSRTIHQVLRNRWRVALRLLGLPAQVIVPNDDGMSDQPDPVGANGSLPAGDETTTHDGTGGATSSPGVQLAADTERDDGK